MDIFIPVYRPFLCGNEKAYVNQCLDSGWISSKGEFINRFEQAFAHYVGVNHAVSVCNGTVALHLALEALGIGTGDEVIVPTLTYIASVNTILQIGASPVYVDSLERTWQIDPDDIVRKITSRTKAVMIVHLYGLPCDMEAITDICAKYNLKLIEDCAEAFGTQFNGRHVGGFGDIATFSFFGNKTITTGEGGMVVTKSAETFGLACHLKNQGVSKTREYWHDVVAYNYRMTNICAAVGLAQIEQADRILAEKRKIAGWYKEELVGLPLLTHDEISGTVHSFWMCSIAVHDALVRDSLRNKLREAGVETRPVFYPAHTMPHCVGEGHFPIAQSISARGINLPSYPELTRDEVRFVGNVIREFFLTVPNKS
jgi:perosamine synthetase